MLKMTFSTAETIIVTTAQINHQFNMSDFNWSVKFKALYGMSYGCDAMIDRGKLHCLNLSS